MHILRTKIFKKHLKQNFFFYFSKKQNIFFQRKCNWIQNDYRRIDPREDMPLGLARFMGGPPPLESMFEGRLCPVE